MNDFESLEFGLVGLALIIIYKLVDAIPRFQKKETRVVESIALGMTELITILKSNSFTMTEEAKTQTAMLTAADASHHADYVRRPNGSWLWVNDPEKEKEIAETNEVVKATHKKVKNIETLLQKASN